MPFTFALVKELKKTTSKQIVKHYTKIEPQCVGSA